MVRTTSIAVVDDHYAMRDGLETILLKKTSATLVKKFAGSKDLFAEMQTTTFDLVLLDIELKDEWGLDILKEIKTRYKNTKVLMVSMYDEFVGMAHENKADGYVSKNTDSEELQAAIDAIVYRNESFYKPEAWERICRRLEANKQRHGHSKTELSDREIEVMVLLCERKKDTEIASMLGISISTVETHRKHILKKIGGHNGADILIYAIQNGLYIVPQKRSGTASLRRFVTKFLS